MKKLMKITRLASVLAVLPLAASLAILPVAAQNQGQIEGGDIYRIENLTQNLPFNSTQTANACDTLEYKVRLYNPDDVNVDNVTVTATLTSQPETTFYSNLTASSTDATPPAVYATATLNLTSSQTVSYVSGSTQLLDVNGNLIQDLPDGFVTPSGINIGTLTPSEVEYVQFEAKVGCPSTPPPTPTFACTALGLTAEENRTVKISNFTTSQTNTTFTNANITWGDNSTPLTTASPVGQTHQYAADGTYTVTATANFGPDQTASGPNCTQTVTFSSTAPPTVTPPTTPTPPATPTALVNTGPGSVIGIFAAATIGGAVLYRRLLARRLSRQ